MPWIACFLAALLLVQPSATPAVPAAKKGEAKTEEVDVAAKQRPAAAPQMVEKMKPAAFLLGEWEGEGWTGSAAQRNEFRIKERVTSKLGGRVFLIEGLGTAKSEGAEEGAVLHEALANLSFDKDLGEYRMRAFKADGAYVDAKAELSDGKLWWGFEVPSWGQVRFTATLKEGRWHEIGEMSRDGGKTWMRFLEMTLTKKS